MTLCLFNVLAAEERGGVTVGTQTQEAETDGQACCVQMM
jgi:hypothetical protein